MYRIVRALEAASIVKDIKLFELIDEETVNLLKIKVTLVDDSILHISESHTTRSQKYSYHWQKTDGELIIRWDNSPHWTSISTYPHHKHISDKVLPSARVAIDEVLSEIEKLIVQP